MFDQHVVHEWHPGLDREGHRVLVLVAEEDRQAEGGGVALDALGQAAVQSHGHRPVRAAVRQRSRDEPLLPGQCSRATQVAQTVPEIETAQERRRRQERSRLATQQTIPTTPRQFLQEEHVELAVSEQQLVASLSIENDLEPACVYIAHQAPLRVDTRPGEWLLLVVQ